MKIKLKISEFNAEMNGYLCSEHFSENLKAIESRLGCFTLVDANYNTKIHKFEYVPYWIFSEGSQRFVAQVGFDENGCFYSKIIRAPKNIKIETLTKHNEFCVQIISTFLAHGLVYSESEGDTE